MEANVQSRLNLITSYGLFWTVDKSEWLRGEGRSPKGRMLGRLGKTGGRLRVCDLWSQSGIYVLYGNYGPYYVGIAHKLGYRVRHHLKDDHRGNWDRFSWFGTSELSTRQDGDGLTLLPKAGPGDTESRQTKPSRGWADVEAVLFRALGLGANLKAPSFGGPTTQWEQIGYYEVDRYLKRIKLS